MTPDNVHVSDSLQTGIGDDDGRLRCEVAQILNGIHVEVNLIRNSKPHMVLCPAGDPLYVQVMKDIYVVGGAIAAARPASKGKSGNKIVVDRAQCSDGSRRIHNDPPRIDHLCELADNLLVAREDDRRVSESSRMSESPPPAVPVGLQ